MTTTTSNAVIPKLRILLAQFGLGQLLLTMIPNSQIQTLKNFWSIIELCISHPPCIILQLMDVLNELSNI